MQYNCLDLGGKNVENDPSIWKKIGGGELHNWENSTTKVSQWMKNTQNSSFKRPTLKTMIGKIRKTCHLAGGKKNGRWRIHFSGGHKKQFGLFSWCIRGCGPKLWGKYPIYGMKSGFFGFYAQKRVKWKKIIWLKQCWHMKMHENKYYHKACDAKRANAVVCGRSKKRRHVDGRLSGRWSVGGEEQPREVAFRCQKSTVQCVLCIVCTATPRFEDVWVHLE